MANTGQVAQSAFPIILAPAAPAASVAQSSFLLILIPAPVPACNNPPAGRVNAVYSHTFTATGATPPYTWAVTGGALPGGLSLSSAGVVSGVPSISGVFSFQITATDSAGASTALSCSITINALAIAAGGGGGFRGIRPSSCGFSPAILAAEKLRRLSVRRRTYPYSYVFPAPATIPVDLVGVVAVPGAGSSVLVLSYTVPEGLRLILQGVLQDYAGGGAAFTAGDALWTLDINNGAANVQAMPIQGLTDVPVPLGSVAAGSVWEFPRAYTFSPLTLIQARATNVNLAGGFFHSGLLGYLVPDVPK